MDTEGLLGLLQFADGLFPAGGYAHSFGLETCAQAGTVATREDLEAFLLAFLEGSAGPGEAVAVVAAWRRAAQGDLLALLALDAQLDARKPVPELREASRQMGRQTLRAASAAVEHPLVARLRDVVETRRSPGHHAMVFGTVTHSVGASAEAAAAAYLHSTAALLVNAALRLLPLGQVDGQKTLAAVRPVVARWSREAAARGADDYWSFTPALDLASLRHARLDARLFRS
jgi:urease accessory protein